MEQKEKPVLMHFQKQANYRARKKKIEAKRNILENQKELKKKAAKKERDRIRYLEKKSLRLQTMQKHLEIEQKKIQLKKKEVLAQLKLGSTKQRELEKELKKVQEETTTLEHLKQNK